MTDPLKAIHDAIIFQQLGQRIATIAKPVVSGEAHVTSLEHTEGELTVFVADKKGSAAIKRVIEYLHKQETPFRAARDN